MASIFQKRVVADYGTAIVKYNAGGWGALTENTWDAETKMLYLIGRSPGGAITRYKDTPEWKTFLNSKNLTEDTPLEILSATASKELAARVVDEKLIERLSSEIIAKIEAEPGRNFSAVRIASPFPIDPDATKNTFAPALAAAVTAALEQRLPGILAEKGLKNIEVIADLDPARSSHEQSILNIVNNNRGKTSNPKPGEEVATYMQRLVRQPVYSGIVDENAIYVPVDDFLVGQSTAGGLVNYIQAGGAVTTSVVAAVKLFNGVEVLAPQQETLDLLKLVMRDKAEDAKNCHREDVYHALLNGILKRTGTHIDFDDVKKTNLPNMELMFVAGYFADGKNPAHQAAFEKALKAVGSSLDEARGNSVFTIFSSQAGSFVGMGKVFDETIQDRKLLVSEGDQRYQHLVKTSKATNYFGVSL